MAERALTEEAMLAGLNDIRLPSSSPGGLAADLLAAAGLGIAAALLLAALLRLVTRARMARPARADPGERELDEGTEDACRRAALRRLKRDDPARYANLAADLYRKGGLPPLEALE